MLADVRFGSKADVCGAQAHVRFTPDSDRESGLPQQSCLLYADLHLHTLLKRKRCKSLHEYLRKHHR